MGRGQSSGHEAMALTGRDASESSRGTDIVDTPDSGECRASMIGSAPRRRPSPRGGSGPCTGGETHRLKVSPTRIRESTGTDHSSQGSKSAGDGPTATLVAIRMRLRVAGPGPGPLLKRCNGMKLMLKWDWGSASRKRGRLKSRASSGPPRGPVPLLLPPNRGSEERSAGCLQTPRWGSCRNRVCEEWPDLVAALRCPNASIHLRRRCPGMDGASGGPWSKARDHHGSKEVLASARSTEQ